MQRFNAMWLTVGLICVAVNPAWTANVIKSNTTTMQANGTDWASAPDTSDVGVFDSTISAGNAAALTLGGNLSIGGLQFDGTLNGPVTIASGGTLTLNNAGTDLDLSAANQNVTVNSTVELGANQTWNVASARTLTIGGQIVGAGGFTKDGAGTAVLGPSGVVYTYAGSTVVNAGTLTVRGTPPSGPVAGMALWLDASDATTLFTDAAGTTPVSVSGDLVRRWKDKTSNHNDVTLVGTQVAPAYQTSVAYGLSVVRFSSTSACGMTSSLNVGSGNASIFIVYSYRSTASAGRRALQGAANNWLMGPYTGAYRTFNNGFVGTPVACVQNQLVLQEVVITTGGVLTTYLDGTSRGGSTGGYPGVIALGSAPLGGGGSGEVLDGDIAEVLVYTSALSASDRVSVETYLRAKWEGVSATVGPSPLPTATAVNLAGASAVLDLGSLTGGTIGSLSGVAGSQIQLGAAALVAGDSTSSTFAGTVSGTGGFTTAGTGTLTLTGNNTYSGGTIINSGSKLRLGDGVANNGTVTGDITDHGALVLANPTAWTYSGVISGTGSLTQSGPGAQTLSGASSYTGNTIVNNGRLTLKNMATTWGNGSTVGITSGATLEFNMTSAWQPAANMTVTGMGTVVKSGAGTMDVTWNGVAGFGMNLTTNATIRVEAGTLRFGYGTSSGSASWNNNKASLYIASGATFDTWDYNTNPVFVDMLSGSGTVTHGSSGAGTLSVGVAGGSDTFSGTIANGTGLALTKLGTGTQTLTGPNTYANGTVVSNGVLSFASGALGSSGAIKMNGGTLHWYSGNAQDISARITMVNGTAATFDTGANSVTFGSAVGNSSSGSFVKTGAGTITLGVANAYTGGSTLNAGTLLIAHANALGTSGTITFNGGTLSSSSSSPYTLGNSGSLVILGNATLGQSGSGALTLPGSCTLSTLGHTITVNNSSTLSGVFAGAGSLTKSGAGTLTLAGVNTFSGVTTVNNGVLMVGDSGALQGSTLDYDSYGGALSFGTQTIATFGGLKGGQALPLVNDSAAGVALIVGNNNATTTYGGALSGSGSLTKGGAGTLEFNGGSAHTYTGPTIITSSGRLALNKTAGVVAIPGDMTITNTAAPYLYMLADNQLGGNGVLTFIGGGGNARVELGNTAQSVAGIVEANGVGVIQHQEGSAANPAGVGTLTLTGSGNYTFNGYLRGQVGTLALSKTGAGTQTLSGGYISYTGNTTVNNGRLILQNMATTWGNGGTVTISNGATVEFNMTGGWSPAANMTVTGAGTFVKSGAATMDVTWNGVSGFGMNLTTNAAIRVEAGTLRFGYGQSSGNASWNNNKASLYIAGGATFDMWDYITNPVFVDALSGSGTVTHSNSGAGTLTVGVAGGSDAFSGAIINGTGLAVIKVGTGTQTLTGPNTYANGTSLAGGVLSFANGALGSSGAITMNGGTLQWTSGNVQDVSARLVMVNGTMATFDTGANSVTFANAVGSSSSASLVKAGTGTLILANASTYSGTTTINNGLLQLGHAGALQGSTLDYNSYGGTLSFGTQATATFGGLKGGQALALANDSAAGVALIVGNNNATTTYGGALSGSGSLTKGGTGTLEFNGGSINTYAGPTIITSSGRLALNKTAGVVAIPGDITITNAGAPYLYMLADNQLGGNGVLTFVGGGSNARVEIGNTAQSVAGIVEVNGAGVIQHKENTAASGAGTGTLTLTGGGSYTFNGYLRDVTGVLALTKTGSGTQTLSGGQISYSGATTIQQGRLVYNGSAYLSTGTITIDSGATLEVSPTASCGNYNVALSGGGTYRKTGANLWDINYNNGASKSVSFSSGALIDVEGGTLRLAYAGGNWTSNLANLNIATGATFDMWDNSVGVNVNALTGGGTFIKGTAYPGGNGTLTVGVDNGSGTFSGVLKNGTHVTPGVLSLTKTGSGTQTLSGNNTYTGTTTINGGMLKINGTHSGSGTVTVSTSGTLAGTGTLNSAVGVGSGCTLAPGDGGVGALTVKGTTFSSGTLAVQLGGGSCTVLNDTGTFNATGGTLTVSGAVAPNEAYTIVTAVHVTGRFNGLPASGTAIPGTSPTLYINYYPDQIQLSPVVGMGTVYTIR